MSAKNSGHWLVHMFGSSVIVLARGMNRCWDRAILLKELMHLWDDPDEMVDTGDAFERQLSGMSVSDFGHKPVSAELLCVWKAILLFCREEERQHLLQTAANGPTDTYAVALQLRMPELYVPLLLGKEYEDAKRLLANA